MKKATKSRAKSFQPELRSEYRFDYSQARPNRFAAQVRSGTLAVVLDPDVAEVFQSGAAVNEVLRSIIRVWPAAKRSRPATSSHAPARKEGTKARTTKR